MTETTLQKKKTVADVLAKSVLCVGFILIFLLPSVFASDNSTQLDMAKVIMNGVGSDIEDMLTGAGTYGAFYSYMTGTGFETLFNSAFLVIKVLGFMWCVAVAMSKLITLMEKGQDSMETIFRVLLEICVTGMFIINLEDVLGWIVLLGNNIIELITHLTVSGAAAGAAAGDAEASDLLKHLDKNGKDTGGFIWGLGMNVKLFLPYAISQLLRIVAKFIALQLLIEIGLRRAFAPLAVADIYQEGLRSPGVRYLKRYFAVFLKIAMALLICKIGAAMISLVGLSYGTGTGGALSYVFEIVAINFTVIGAMFKSGEIANDVVGA